MQLLEGIHSNGFRSNNARNTCCSCHVTVILPRPHRRRVGVAAPTNFAANRRDQAGGRNLPSPLDIATMSSRSRKDRSMAGPTKTVSSEGRKALNGMKFRKYANVANPLYPRRRHLLPESQLWQQIKSHIKALERFSRQAKALEEDARAFHHSGASDTARLNSAWIEVADKASEELECVDDYSQHCARPETAHADVFLFAQQTLLQNSRPGFRKSWHTHRPAKLK